jgi:hypothetical protein
MDAAAIESRIPTPTSDGRRHKGVPGKPRAAGFKRVCRPHPFALEVQESGWRLLSATEIDHISFNHSRKRELYSETDYH